MWFGHLVLLSVTPVIVALIRRSLSKWGGLARPLGGPPGNVIESQLSGSPRDLESQAMTELIPEALAEVADRDETIHTHASTSISAMPGVPGLTPTAYLKRQQPSHAAHLRRSRRTKATDLHCNRLGTAMRNGRQTQKGGGSSGSGSSGSGGGGSSCAGRNARGGTWTVWPHCDRQVQDPSACDSSKSE